MSRNYQIFSKWLFQKVFKEGEEKDGPGSAKEPNGIYEGDWKNNKKEGIGKKLYVDKSFFIGEWKEDKKNGQV